MLHVHLMEYYSAIAQQTADIWNNIVRLLKYHDELKKPDTFIRIPRKCKLSAMRSIFAWQKVFREEELVNLKLHRKI